MLQKHSNANMYQLMGRITLAIAIPATISVLIGNWLDQTFGTEHKLVTLSLALGLAVTWSLIYHIYRLLEKELAAKKEQTSNDTHTS